MNVKLHVGNLSQITREADLANTFMRVGLVMSVSIPLDARTGNARNFGFVDMGTEAGAQAAVTKLNGTMLCESQITVREAKAGE
jgi:RNA recognition motif-containing protein